MLTLVYQDLKFEANEETKYVNASQICQYFGKDPYDFLRLKKTKLYIAARATNSGIPESELVKIEDSQNFDKKASKYWFHPKLVIKLARWLDINFEIWCNKHLIRLLTTGKTQLDAELEQKRLELARVKQELAYI